MLDQITVIAEQSRTFAEILRSGPLDAEVPGTPGWNLEELGWHMVGVQQWATLVIQAGVAPTQEIQRPDGSPGDALDASSQALIAALNVADPDTPCWNFTPTAPHVTSFWFRRQANEVAIHRWDAASAVSEDPPEIPAELAAQIIDEFVHVMMPRVIDREGVDVSTLASDVHVHCTDVAGEWTFEIIDGEVAVSNTHRKAAVAIRGRASDLAMFLYNRLGTDHVEIFGDVDELEKWRPAFRA